jgi:hypothetical protein
MKNLSKIALALGAAITLAACGGGGSSTASNNVNVGGQVTKGPTANAQVCAYLLVNSVKGALIGCTQSLADSSYSLSVPANTEILIEAIGGTYVDEATSVVTPLGTTLVAMTKTGASTNGTDSVVITALTTAATKTDPAGMSMAKYKAHLAKLAALLGISEVDLSKQLSTFSSGNVPTSRYDVVLASISQMIADGKSLDAIITMLKTSTHDSATYTAVADALKKYVSNKSIKVAVSPPTSATSSTKICKVDWSQTKSIDYAFVDGQTPPAPVTTTGTICVVSVPSATSCEGSSSLSAITGANFIFKPVPTASTEVQQCTGTVETYSPPFSCPANEPLCAYPS